MANDTKRTEALRTLLERERKRELEEHRSARAKQPLTETEAHQPVSNRVSVSESAAFEPSFGSLGRTEAAASGAVREVMAEAKKREKRGGSPTPSEEPVDAYWGSFGSAADRELARDPGLSTLVVIDEDDRVEVTDTESYPWRCICSLRMLTQDNRNFIGTGWLVSPRLVLTAGHCVFFHNHGGWAQRIEVIPGRRGSNQPFGSAVSTAFRSVRGWTQNRDRDYDYGAIILPESSRFGDQLGWFGYATRSDDELEGATMNLAGYPGDQPSGTQWFHARRLEDVDDRVLTYEIDTAGGQSGAPVWQLLPDGGRYGVGIHTNGSHAGNSATRINSEVFNNIISWVGQAP